MLSELKLGLTEDEISLLYYLIIIDFDTTNETFIQDAVTYTFETLIQWVNFHRDQTTKQAMKMHQKKMDLKQ